MLVLAISCPACSTIKYSENGFKYRNSIYISKAKCEVEEENKRCDDFWYVWSSKISDSTNFYFNYTYIELPFWTYMIKFYLFILFYSLFIYLFYCSKTTACVYLNNYGIIRFLIFRKPVLKDSHSKTYTDNVKFLQHFMYFFLEFAGDIIIFFLCVYSINILCYTL